MKKVIIGVVLGLIVGVALGVAPGVVGMAAERQFKAIHGAASEQMQTPIHMTYQRNWFSSEAETIFDLREAILARVPPWAHSALQDIPPLHIKTVHEIDHGPLAGMSGKGLEPALARMKNISTLTLPDLGGPTSLVLETFSTIFLDGGGESEYVIPEIINARYGDVLVNLAECRGNARFTRDLRDVVSTFAVPALNMSSAGEALSVSNLTLESSVEREDTWTLSTSTVRFASLATSADGQAEKNLQLSGLTLHSLALQTGETVSTSLQLSFDGALAQTQRFGPGVLNFAVRNIHAPTMLEIRQAVEDYQRATAQSDGQNQLGAMLLMARIAGILPRLAAHAPECELADCSLITPHGEFLLDGHLTMQAGEETGGLDVSKFARLLDLDLALTLPATFVEQELMQEDARQGGFALQDYLVKQGDNYELKAAFHDAKLTVNGEPFDLPFL